jgi:hypothetical protein
MNRWDRRLLVVAALIASSAGGAFLVEAAGHGSGGPERPTPTHQPAPDPPVGPSDRTGARLV